MPHKEEKENKEEKLTDVRAHMKTPEAVGYDTSWEANEGALIKATKEAAKGAIEFLKSKIPAKKKQRNPSSGGVRG